MSKSHVLAALAAGVAAAATLFWMAISGSDAAAQPPGRAAMRPAPGGPSIALLDVSHIFRKHVRFKAMMDELKADAARAETEVKQEQAALRKLGERLKDFRPGSPDYNALEEEITERRTRLTIDIQRQRKDFLKREAKIHYNIYQEILQEVNYYARSNNVAMVLRFNREAPDVEKPENVLAYINKTVVTYATDFDITDLILQRLNRRPVNPSSTAPHGPARRSSHGVHYE